MQYYEDFEEKPEIMATHGAFMLTLPNMNYARPLREKQKQKPQHKVVMDYLQNNPYVTNEIIQELLYVKQTRAYMVIKEMLNDGLIVKAALQRPQDRRASDADYRERGCIYTVPC